MNQALFDLIVPTLFKALIFGAAIFLITWGLAHQRKGD